MLGVARCCSNNRGFHKSYPEAKVKVFYTSAAQECGKKRMLIKQKNARRTAANILRRAMGLKIAGNLAATGVQPEKISCFRHEGSCAHGKRTSKANVLILN